MHILCGIAAACPMSEAAGGRSPHSVVLAVCCCLSLQVPTLVSRVEVCLLHGHPLSLLSSTSSPWGQQGTRYVSCPWTDSNVQLGWVTWCLPALRSHNAWGCPTCWHTTHLACCIPEPNHRPFIPPSCFPFALHYNTSSSLVAFLQFADNITHVWFSLGCRCGEP